MTANTENRAPTHSLFVVTGNTENPRWARIGAAWPNQDDKGFSMSLDATPIGGRIVMRETKPQAESDAT